MPALTQDGGQLLAADERPELAAALPLPPAVNSAIVLRADPAAAGAPLSWLPSRLEAQMSDDFPVTPAGNPTRNLKIDGGDSSGNGLPLAHQGVPHIFAAPGHPTIVPYTVCTGKAPGRT